MTQISEPKIQRLKIADISADWDARFRDVSDAGVESLIASIEEIGVMKDPVHVRRIGRGDQVRLVLIAGGHRLTAAMRLGWETIPARVWADISDSQAAFMEIDDNLAGKRLDVLEETEFLTERQRVFLQVHPEAKRGHAGNLASHGLLTADFAVSSFVKATAEATGYSERKIYSRIAVGKALSKEEFKALRSAPTKVKAGDLDALAKIREASDRRYVIGQIAAGHVASVGEAIAKLKPEAPKTDPDAQAFDKLLSAWKRAPMKVKRRFLEDRQAEIADILRGKPDLRAV